MTLPKIAIPTFDLTIPSTEEKIKFRPFLCKEEKVLLIAESSHDNIAMYEAMKQIVSVCVLTSHPKNFDVNVLTLYDLEYVFLNIRAKSVNNIIVQTYRDTEDDKSYKVNIDLEKIVVTKKDKNFSNKFKLTDSVGVVMKELTLKEIDQLIHQGMNIEYEEEYIDQYLRLSIDQVYDSTNVSVFKEESKGDQDDWLSSLTHGAMEKLKEYFRSLPKLYYKIEYTNSKGTKREIVLSSLSDFFTW